MSKKSWPILYSELLSKMVQVFLDMHKIHMCIANKVKNPVWKLLVLKFAVFSQLKFRAFLCVANLKLLVGKNVAKLNKIGKVSFFQSGEVYGQ